MFCLSLSHIHTLENLYSFGLDILRLPLGFFLFIVWTPHFCGFPTQNHQPHRSHINTESSEGYRNFFPFLGKPLILSLMLKKHLIVQMDEIYVNSDTSIKEIKIYDSILSSDYPINYL